MAPLPVVSPAALDRVRGALWGVYIADALSMPVHWYYDIRRLQQDFGRITGYEAPKKVHPGSIMSVSSTGGHGRGGQSGRIVGDIINHGKHDRWGKPGVHYHEGMAAGENTLNALCARVATRGIAQRCAWSAEAFLEDYVKFMTTPGSHNDTYAESYHRDFFRNWAAGVPPEKCSQGTEGHNTASIGGFVTLPPVILSCLRQGLDAAQDAAVRLLALTHESRALGQYAKVYSQLVFELAQGREAKEAIRAAAADVGVDLDKALRYDYDDTTVVQRVYGSACYITDSFPSVLYLAYKHADSFEDAVLANTNAGGENCHRGSALGAIVGAAHGASGIPPRLIEGLHDSRAIRTEIEQYITALFPEEAAAEKAGGVATAAAAAGGSGGGEL
ncbi:ADP-ribosylation crystallin J1 [Micractinium conductrix]|uniref:ADP-ribosylation crystallin J1 n=1 Tax=Micractinium conductrix TaxID=554055 RepID=A0A2P6VKI1_9CHLO|nr:ADP-ribosylation crystallin J1 [Micractinium conductrix]|eukprot:PSC74603.1 ADP-ribosylation crystallin J1 [Micractinium conductrix]